MKAADPSPGRARALALVALAELMAMGLWFGVSAVAPQIAAEWRLDRTETSWLTLAVQVGFVAGTLLSATLNLPDVIRTRHLFAVSACWPPQRMRCWDGRQTASRPPWSSVAGLVADRFGRPLVAAAAMAVSGACCLLIGFFFGRSAIALIALAAIWGASVVADSAQFSACVTEYSDPRYVGTALTLQTCIGFLITTVSIGVLPLAVERIGWTWAFALLAPGPLLGIVAMMSLRRL